MTRENQTLPQAILTADLIGQDDEIIFPKHQVVDVVQAVNCGDHWRYYLENETTASYATQDEIKLLEPLAVQLFVSWNCPACYQWHSTSPSPVVTCPHCNIHFQTQF